MSLFPGALPSAGSASPSDTLATAGHTSLHNTGADETRAVATKIGTGASTPTSGKLLKGNGVGTSAWGQADLTTDVTGVLPQANGGTGTTLATGTGKAVYDTSPTLVAPTIADFTNSTHTHASNAQGGQLNGANAITDGTLTPAELVAGTGSTWVQTAFTPTISSSGGTITTKSGSGLYIQIGKYVFWEMTITVTTNGTGSGSVIATMPINSAANNIYVGNGRANVVSGKQLQSYTAGGSTMQIYDATGAYPAADGETLILNGFYRVS